MTAVGHEDAGAGRQLPLVFAHRGAWFDDRNRQNSLEAFADAAGSGVALESDVPLSADGVPVLVHDAVLWYAFVPIVVGWMRAGWLHRFGIPSLEELYREVGGDHDLSVDLKV